MVNCLNWSSIAVTIRSLDPSLFTHTYSGTKCYTPQKTPDESGNYNHAMRVTFRYGIGIS